MVNDCPTGYCFCGRTALWCSVGLPSCARAEFVPQGAVGADDSEHQAASGLAPGCSLLSAGWYPLL